MFHTSRHPVSARGTRRSTTRLSDHRFRAARLETLESRCLLSIVTNWNDSGLGSLRDRVASAAAGDTITFDSSLAGHTITLTTSNIVISRPLTIQGLGASQLTVDGNHSGVHGVFQIDRGITAQITGMRVTAGGTYDAITNAGFLSISNCAISGNNGVWFESQYGGSLTVSNSNLSANASCGIYCNGSGGTSTIPLNVTGSSISNNSGSGIYIYQLAANLATSIQNSVISGNRSYGIYCPGTTVVSNSTISGNGSGGYGGGICNEYQGNLKLINSTIWGNMASNGAGIANWGTLTVTNGTIAQNTASNSGGGIYQSSSGTTTLNNTIVANNSSSSSPDIYGTVSANYCLIRNTAGATFSGALNVTNRDPVLGWLGSYGGAMLPDGSQMQTAPPLAGSPAIDAGSTALIPSGVFNDQRGWYRIFSVNGAVDIGACENQPGPTAQDALINQVSRISPATFDGIGSDVEIWLGNVVPGQQVQVYVGQTQQDLRPVVGTFTNTNGDLPWRVLVDLAAVGLPQAEYVAVTSDKPALILSARGSHPSATDLSGYRIPPVVASSEPQLQAGNYTNVAQLYRWEWSQSKFVSLPEADWSNASVVNWTKQTIILTHGWNASLTDPERKAQFIWDFASDFMVGRQQNEYTAFNIVAIDWYDGGSRKGSDPNNYAPLIELNLGDAQESAKNGIAAAKALTNRLIAIVGLANLHPEKMMFIGHSNGAGFMASMALALDAQSGHQVGELVALDAPNWTSAWEEVKSAARSVLKTENYYMPKYEFGAGKRMFGDGIYVINFQLGEVASLTDGVVSIGHGVVPKRYANTADNLHNHSHPWGFQESAFVNSTSPYDGYPFWVESQTPGDFVWNLTMSGQEVVSATKTVLDSVRKATYSIWNAGVRVIQDIDKVLKGSNTSALIAGDLGHMLGTAHSPVYGSIDVKIPQDADLLEFNLSVMDPGVNDRLLVVIGNDVLQEIDLASVQAIRGVTVQAWVKGYAGQSTTATFYMPSNVTSSAQFLISDVNFVTVNFPPIAAEPQSVVIANSTATFTVTYSDPDDSVLYVSIGNSNVQVTGPNGFSQSAALVSVDQPGDDSTRTATYRITAPGGAWAQANVGTYTAWMQPNQVSDTGGNYVLSGALGTFTMNTPVTLNPTALPAGTVNVPYNQTITAAGGAGNITLVISNIQESIAGLVVPTSGSGILNITGRPTITGTETFTVTATDSAGGSCSATYSITVNSAVTVSPTTLPAGSVNVVYNQAITASGGTGVITLVVSNIQNPITGLVVPNIGTGTLNITGTPTSTGTETFTVTATDSVGGTYASIYSIRVNKTARDLGTLGAATVAVNDFIGSSDTEDYYRFQIPLDGPVTVCVSGLSADVDLQWVSDTGAVLGTVSHSGTTDELATATFGGNWPYYLRVYRVSGDTNYTLTLIRGGTAVFDTAGNSIAAARDLGNLSASKFEMCEYVGGADSADYFRFQQPGPGEGPVTVSVSGLSANVDLQWLSDTGAVLGTVSHAGTTDEVATASFGANWPYYLRVYIVSGSSSYTLSITRGGTATLDSAGSSIAAARDLGTIQASASEMYEYLGSTDTDDYFGFRQPTEGPVTVSVSGLGADVDLQWLSDTGVVLGTVSHAGNTDEIATATFGPNWPYYLRVYSVSGASTSYVLSLSRGGTTTVDLAGNNIAAARDLGNLRASASEMYEYVGSADTDDYYCFRQPGEGPVTVSVSGLTANVDLQWLSDTGVILGTVSHAGTSDEIATATFGPDWPYYLRVYSVGGNTNYSLSLSRGGTATFDTAGNSLAAARDLGTITASAAQVIEYVGAADSQDYFCFRQPTSGPIQVTLAGLTANADLQVLSSTGSILGSSALTGVASETVTLTFGGNWPYYIRVYQASGNTSYTLSLTKGAPLLAEGGSTSSASLIPSSQSLIPLLGEALSRWAVAGVRIAAPQVIVTDLPGAELGRAVGDTIYIDGDAAGHGWFIDSTPAVDEEFARLSADGALRAVDPRAVDRIDLLTVIEHELGHVAGLPDLDASLDALMSGALGVGVRRGPRG